jgi:predicted nucleic acid-binding protein
LKAVVDTNVIAYHVLQTERFAEECSRFWRAVEEPMAPASWEAELVNVLWLTARQSIVTLSEALDLLKVLATFDEAVIRAFPRVAIHPAKLTKS